MPVPPHYAVLETWPDAILVLDSVGLAVFASAAARALAGRDLVGNDPALLVGLLGDHADELRRLCPADAVPPPSVLWRWLPAGVWVEHRFHRVTEGLLVVVGRRLDDLVPRAQVEREQALLERRLLHAQKL